MHQEVYGNVIVSQMENIFAIKEIHYDKEKSRKIINEINILSEVESKFIVKYIEHFIDHEQRTNIYCYGIL